jgi:hypothetical protein
VKDSEVDIERLRGRLDEMTVVAFWIEFERFIVAHITAQLSVAAAAHGDFVRHLEAHIERQIEFSRFDDLLDLYKGWMDSNDVGRVKQIKDYRDWINHRNPKRPTPIAVLPIVARRVLGNVMDQIR